MVITDHTKLIQSLDELISGYRLKDAIAIIKSLDFSQIPLKFRSDFAQLARRAHLYKEAIKLLQDKVYGSAPAETKDILEYASSIRKLGMVQQCLNLLERVPDQKDKFLYQSYCYVHNWDYEKAQIYLEKFLHQPDLSDREKVVAKLNLSSCLIYNHELDAAQKMIAEIEGLCQDKYFQFYLNCLEMRGQIYIQQGEIGDATKMLAQAHELVKKESGNTSLFIEKWKLVADLKQNPSPVTWERIIRFKQAIRTQGHWETLRDFDYQTAVTTEDYGLLNYVYFGTPFESFKKRVAKEQKNHLTSKYLWVNQKADHSVTNHLDPLDAQIKFLPFGLIQHRLLLVLLSDFYRPWSLYRIFDSLFPDEIYDVDSSPKRIYGLIKKMQDALRLYNMPFELGASMHGYRLRHKPGGMISIYEKMHFKSSEEIVHFAMQNRYKLQEFTPQEMADVMGISPHKAYRWISEMEQAGLLIRDKQMHKIHLKAS